VLRAVAAACSVLRCKVLGGSLHGAGASLQSAGRSSTLQRQFQARCRVNSKHAAAAAQSALRR